MNLYRHVISLDINTERTRKTEGLLDAKKILLYNMMKEWTITHCYKNITLTLLLRRIETLSVSEETGRTLKTWSWVYWRLTYKPRCVSILSAPLSTSSSLRDCFLLGVYWRLLGIARPLDSLTVYPRLTVSTVGTGVYIVFQHLRISSPSTYISSSAWLH